MLGGGIKSFLKEHKAPPILLALVVGLTFGLSRLALADTVTLKYRDESSNEQSLILNKGTTIYLDPNFGYFKKDNNKRTKKFTLNTDLDLTNNDDININSYAVAKQSDPKEDLLNEKYAWGKNTTFSSIRTMQEMTPTICEAETTPTKDAVDTTITHSTDTNLVPEARLKDTRDNKYYTVRKLADGSCWMTDNLAYAKAGALEPTGSDVQNTKFSLANSDIYAEEGEKWKDTVQKKFIYDRPDPVYSFITKTTTSNSPFKGWRKTRLSNGSISLKAIYGIGNPYGNLYTWRTATAGSGNYAYDGANASSSICPRGWRLPPYHYGTKNYRNLLFVSYGLQSDTGSSIKMQSHPLDFSLTGYYNCVNGRVYDTDNRGYYWSSIVSSSRSVYGLDFNNDNVDPQGRYYKVHGISVRCLAR